MQLGVNSVLFGSFDFATAAKCIALAGYDGIEISALKGMGEHLVLDNWQQQKSELQRIVQENGLKFLATEVATLDEERLLKAFQACSEIGIPVVNIGPGGKADVPEDLPRQIDMIAQRAATAEKYGVTLCVKAHVGCSIYNTPTTLAAMKKITSPAFGIDMDPSHIWRAGENPVEALSAVISGVKHIHIRDCKGRQQGPGKPELQANGRGDIDLLGYIRVLHESGYTGAVDLEVIGAGEYSLEQCCIIAAESRGHMQACLQACGAR
jgi:sugar phosphate isomerase/epimerase